MNDQSAQDLPEHLRLYVVGDIHGRLDLFDQRCTAIAQDLDRHPMAEVRLVLLGDYIDRGPDSAGVIERLASLKTPAPPICLRGNHETMLQSFLSDPDTMDQWRHFGGLETLASYGVDIQEVIVGQGYLEAQHALSRLMPPHHLLFLADLQNCFELGPYYFCHAGVRPGLPLAQQQADDLLWIREPFLSSDADHGRIIIHGHTPVNEPEFHANRINLDTGAYDSNRLTCLVLERGRCEILA